MTESKEKNDRLLKGVIIIVALTGILYFGYQAISDNSKKDSENPFEYNIEKFKKNGAELMHYSEVKEIPLDYDLVSGIAFGQDENIYVSGDTSILILNIEGERLSSFSTGAQVNCLAVDETGNLYLGMNDHIEVFDRSGRVKARWGSPGDKAIITSIAVSDEFVFAADAGNHIVWKYDKNGNILLRIGEKNEEKDIPGFLIPSPYFDVSIDPDGFLWVANTGRHSLENYTFDGDLRSTWGEFSMEIEGFCGCCNPSHFAIFDDGKFLTAEKGIPRIKVYNRLGELESVVAGSDQFIEGTVGLDVAVDSEGNIYVLDPYKKEVRIFEKLKKNN